MSPQLHDGVKGVGVKGQRTERQGLLSSFFKSEGILQKGGGFGRDDDVKTNLHTPSTTKVNDETGVVLYCTKTFPLTSECPVLVHQGICATYGKVKES